MARAAVFVHPSSSETFGVAAGEAILSGLPVAARPSGGVPWILALSGGYGQIADGGEAAALATAIERVLDGDLAVDSATARQSLVEAIGEAAVARQTLNAYREAIARSAGGPHSEAAADRSTAPAVEADSPAQDGSASVPRILVATGRDHALPLVAGLPSDLRDRLVLVVPAWREGAIEAPNTAGPIRLNEAASVPAAAAPSSGRGPVAGLRRALHRPEPTGDELLSDALLTAAANARIKAGNRRVECVALDAPAAALVARLAGKGVALAPGALRWLADRWDADRWDADEAAPADTRAS